MFGRIDPIPAPLRSSELAGLLPGRELAELERFGTLLRLPEGRDVFRQGEIGRESMVIADGSFTVSRDDVVIAELDAGDVAGELSVISRRPRTATVTATRESLVYVFNAREFRSLLSSCPTLALLVDDMAQERAAAA